MLEKKPKHTNKPLSIYYLYRIQNLRSHANKSICSHRSRARKSIIIRARLVGKWQLAHAHEEKGWVLHCLLCSSHQCKRLSLRLSSRLFSSSFSAELRARSRTDPWAPRSDPALWLHVLCLPARSTVTRSSLHTASGLCNASDLTSDPISITN